MLGRLQRASRRFKNLYLMHRLGGRGIGTFALGDGCEMVQVEEADVV